MGGPFGPRVVAQPREDPNTARGMSLAHDVPMPPKQKNPSKPTRRTPKPPPKVWRWDEVLDAAMTLDEGDFNAVLCDMMMIRYDKDHRLIGRYIERYGAPDVALDDPLEDDDFYDVGSYEDPGVIPMSKRPTRARRR